MEPYKPEHLQELILQPAQARVRANLSDPEYAQALVGKHSFTLKMDGKVVACFGVLKLWEGRGDAWALISGDIGARGMRRLHFEIRKRLEASHEFRRIETACDAGFEQAKRWLELLGFQYEGPLLKYTPDGRDCLRYARIA
jgi:hypothetical protein